MDVLLANAGVKVRNKHSRLSPPLGLAYIGAVLQRNGFSVTGLDINCLMVDPEKMHGIIAQLAPRIMGISVHTETYTNGLYLARAAKEVDPSMTVVMGGPHATVMYPDILREKAVDIVVRGEGEYSMLEVTNCLLRSIGVLGDVTGIAYRDDGKLIVTGDRPFIAHPDELPLPARDLFPLPLYERPGQVLMSRGGCPFDCCFCAVNNIWHGRRRYRETDNVIGEIEAVAESLGKSEIDFADDTFTLNRAQVAALCQQSSQLRDTIDWSWGCTTRVDLVDEQLIKQMARAGCCAITFGVETGSEEVMNAISKRITLAQVRHAVETALREGMSVLCSFMFPHPQDTVETIREQKRFMKDLVTMGSQTSLAFTTPFPGTRYYSQMHKLGIRLLTDKWEEFDAKHLIIETRNLKQRQLEDLFEEIVQDVGLQHD